MYSSSDVNVSYDVGLNRGSLGRLALMVLACLISSSALATTISPVKVELSRAHPVVTITVTNNADLPLIFQSQILAWTQSNGENHLEESTDLLVAPAIVEIDPRGTQVFRVTQRHPTTAIAERAYRLVLDDISGTNQQNADKGVSFVFSHRLPVFVAGTGNIGPQPHLGPCPNSSQLGCVRLHNNGDQYVQVWNLVVTGKNWQEELGAGQRILAGAWLQWSFALPPVSAGRLTVTAETSAGRLSFELPNAAPLPTGSVYDVSQ
ncbi:fimbrial biogenesis chaperone [Aliidiomarina indica]|uniref:fimbrial biogenesis chaperone n=1 Tax=Aliidiomarina indica TaxID=2749147 RepID=UPI00188F83AB|nr:fimbria/pilus periplasmic chaperone [Aliidiomarina indica]